MKKLPLLAFTFLIGCATTMPMTKVIDVCNGSYSSFRQVSQCIYQTYSKNGNTPNATSVKAFYAELAVIGEALDAKKITETQARAAMYRAYSKTVGASNQANQNVVCMPINGMMVCQ